MLTNEMITTKGFNEILSENEKKYIYVLLVRYPDTSGKFFRFLTRSYYNHASIGVNDRDGAFYSYVKTGFRKELPRKHPTYKQHEVPCSLYQISVSEELYDVTKTALVDHEKQAQNFKYNTLGLFFCLLRIVFKQEGKYFCSQFVSEMLEQMRAVPLAKHSSLYLPDDFTRMKGLDLCFSGNLSDLVSLTTPALSH